MYRGDDRRTVTVHSELMDPVRILLVDDHLMVTEALASRLSAAMDLWVAGRCTTADPNLLDIVRGLRPDVITIEVEPLGPAIGEVLQSLMAARPAGQGGGAQRGPRCRARGGGGPRRRSAAWVAKEQGAAELEAVLRGVIQGESVVPAGHARRDPAASCAPTSAGPGSTRTSLDMLSPREREVLLAMMDGKRGGQIATGPADLRRHGAHAHPEHLRQAGRAQPPGSGAGGPGRGPAGT